MFTLICLIQKSQTTAFCIRQPRNHTHRPANWLFI